MTEELARAALNFLGRAELKGNEAPIFLAVVEAIKNSITPKVPQNDPAAVGEQSPEKAS